MNDVGTEAQHGAVREVSSPGGLQALLVTSVKGVVLASAVDADRGPHAMVVRVERHEGGPNYIEHGQIRGPVQNVEPNTQTVGLVIPQRLVRHEPCEDFPNRRSRIGLAHGLDAGGDQLIGWDHGGLPDRRPSRYDFSFALRSSASI